MSSGCAEQTTARAREGGRDGERDGGREGGLPGSPPRGRSPGCSRLPGRHKGAQVINWSEGAKLLKRYSAKPCWGAAACTPPAPAHALHLFIYFFWLPQIRVHRSDISRLPPRRGSPGLAIVIFQADSDHVPWAQGQLCRITSLPGTRPRRSSHRGPCAQQVSLRISPGVTRSTAKNASRTPFHSPVLRGARPWFAPEPGR